MSKWASMDPILIFLVSVAVLGCSGASETDSNRVLADEVYVDPKGFFSMTPPRGWGVQEYPNDARGKVAFLRSKTTDLRVLTNGVDFSDISSLESELKTAEERLGVRTNIKRTQFNGMPAIERDFVLRGQRILFIDFLVGNVSHNLMYSAPRGRYETDLERAKASLATYQPTPQEMTEEEVLESTLAKMRRLGRLFIDLGRYEEAAFYIEAGLETLDTDPALLLLRAELQEAMGR